MNRNADDSLQVRPEQRRGLAAGGEADDKLALADCGVATALSGGYVRLILIITSTILLAGCGGIRPATGKSITAAELESFFREHKVDDNYAVALKKRSAGDAYLATIHGYPDNLSVCEALIEPYNRDPELSAVPGSYFCEELR